MDSRICYHCFSELGNTTGPCPTCGYDAAKDAGKFPLALGPGSILNGRYVVGRALGQGGFGITYVAQDVQTKERVAIKEFFPETLVTRTAGHNVTAFSGQRMDNYLYGKKCFLEEAQTLAQFIGTENIVRVHSYFEENDTAYFAMDYVEGVSLQAYLKQRGGRISWSDALLILLPVMDALSIVHSKGIIHRDIAPDNIYIAKDGTIKLLDFGAARYSLGDRSRSLDVVLKAGYAPKEQYTRRGRQGPYTDVYSLAATFYYCITGKVPPESVERTDSDEDDLILPSALHVRIPPEAEDALEKALAVRAQDRFQTMVEFRAALVSTLEQPAAAQPPTPVYPPVSQQYPPVSQQYPPVPQQYPPVSQQYPPVSQQYPPVPQQYPPVSQQYPPVPQQYPPVSQQYPPVSQQPAAPVSQPPAVPISQPVSGPVSQQGVTPISQQGTSVSQQDQGQQNQGQQSQEQKKDDAPDKPKPPIVLPKLSLPPKTIAAIAAGAAAVVALVVCGIFLLGGDKAPASNNDVSISGTPTESPVDDTVLPGIQVQSLSAGSLFTVGLDRSGSVSAAGYNGFGQDEVSGWRNMASISAGWQHTVGLKPNGTVIAAGDNQYGQCEVSSWADILAISAGGEHTVGLTAEGTVVAAGNNDNGQCEVSEWTDIVAVAAGNRHTLGLLSDGTVISTGIREEGDFQINYGQANVSAWSDITAISAGLYHSVGLKEDGTVVAVGDNQYGQCEVSEWTDIVAVAAGWHHTVGLRADGTVVSTSVSDTVVDAGQSDVAGWQGITAISAGGYHTVGLKENGSVVATAATSDLWDHSQDDVSGWKKIGTPDALS